MLRPISWPTESFTPLLTRMAVGLVAAVLLWPSPAAHAQLTAETLIGDAVSDSVSRYTEVSEAIKRFGNRDVLGARQFLETAVRKNPNLPPVDLMMAKMYFLSGNADAGRASLKKTVDEHPEDPETYLILADQLYSTGRTIEAEALYDKAIRLTDEFEGNPKRKRNFLIRARAGRAAVAELRQDWDVAAEDLKVWADTDPDSANALHRLGRALFLNKKTREGYEYLQQAYQKENSLPHPYVTAAMLYEQMGQRSEAQQTFERAVSSNKDDEKTLTAYAQWLLQTGDVEKAEATLAEARELAPNSLEVLTLSGVAARMAKKMKPAEDYLGEALQLAPSNRSVLNQMALLLIEQPDTEKQQRALQIAQMNAQLNPENSEAQITLAWVMYQLRQSGANQALQQGIRLGNMNADSSYLLAKMLVEQGRGDAAKQILDTALESSRGIFVHRQEAEALRQTLD